MTDGEKIREYRLLNGLSQMDIVKYGDYPKSEKWIGQIERNAVTTNKENIKEIYNHIAIARFNKDRAKLEQEQK